MSSIHFKKVLVVGAGLAGSTIARTLAENKIKVVVLEKRNHIAGNIYDFVNANNERIHKYGPHILHCDKKSEGLKFLSRFTEWITYHHKVRALLKNGQTTPLPINKITLEDVFNKKFRNEEEVRKFLDEIRNKKLIPKNTDQFFEANVGNKLADIFFRPYTEKMWGIQSDKLSINVGARLPIRTDENINYFNDNFQALPQDGYSKMVERILNHKNIKVYLNTDFKKGMELDFDHAFLCVAIDDFFQFKYGVLPYRSIIFKNQMHSGKDQSAPVINFTDKSPYTRKTQWSLFPNSFTSNSNLNTITYEIPCSMDRNPDEYYYPVQTKNSQRIFERYKKLAKAEKDITFCGRIGLFKYIDMIPAVTMHLKIAKNFLKKYNS
tara:strand:- start:5173 stop:6309 length:1137 start_codon:yes stop_codon:yes gene_type:complete